MAKFSVVILTASPPGQAAESGGAFLKVDGREALLRSVELFLNRENVGQVLLAIEADAMDECKHKFGAHLGFTGVKLFAGGPRWMEQIAAAGPVIAADSTHVIIHDAARPAVPFSDIDSVMQAVETAPVVALATPVRSVMIETDDAGHPMAYHLPGTFQHLLTPQAFSREVFLELARTRVEIHASRIKLLKGSPLNIRLGGPGDAGLVKSMIGSLPKPKMKGPASPFDEAQW